MNSLLMSPSNQCGSETLLHIKGELFRCYKCGKQVEIPRLQYSELEYKNIIRKSMANEGLVRKR